jgi:hypothetical protein
MGLPLCMKEILMFKIHDVKNPDDLANQLWNQIRGKCSG